jgi:hypothetical protein
MDSWFPKAGKIGVLGKYSNICSTVSWMIAKLPSLVWFQMS